MPNAYGLELDTQVALHTEGVDRNALAANTQTLCCWVALHTEGVDRNLFLILKVRPFVVSPSARRAWIEISCTVSGSHLASTYGSHPLYKVHMWSLYGGGILLIVTQRSVQLFRVSISSRKPTSEWTMLHSKSPAVWLGFSHTTPSFLLLPTKLCGANFRGGPALRAQEGSSINIITQTQNSRMRERSGVLLIHHSLFTLH
mgnify:CR=1 FL=1